MRRASVCAGLVLALAATPVAVLAGAAPAAAATCPHRAPSDFNGDGIPDVAISDTSGTGAVHVLYGTRSGLTAGPSGTALDDQLLTVTPMFGSDFGEALAVGDIDGD